jgi:hypothetical protein
MGRFVVGMFCLIGLTVLVIAGAVAGLFYMPRRTAFLVIIRVALIVLGAAVLGNAVVAFVQRAYAIARGGKNRETGVQCFSCG